MPICTLCRQLIKEMPVLDNQSYFHQTCWAKPRANLPESVGCMIQCPCGGHVEALQDGLYYTLTPTHTIIFSGICGECGEGVRVERPILSLIAMCPLDKERAN